MKKEMKPLVESYNIDEEYLYNKTYLFIKGYAEGRNYRNTLKALPLARMMHDGQHRKGLQEVEVINHIVEMVVDDSIENNDGTIMKPVVKDVHETISVHLPYILHCLKVCSTLISLNIPLEDKELDILICVALLHDAIEDAEDGFFKNDGHELVSDYGFPEEVYKTIRLLSKRSGATEAELNAYFNEIKKDKIALLVKMADRSHNVEDLYNMVDVAGNKNLARLEKYVLETRRWIYPLSSYAKANYPELSNGVTILKAKIVSLTEATETIVELYEEELKKKDAEIEALKKQLEEKNK